MRAQSPHLFSKLLLRQILRQFYYTGGKFKSINGPSLMQRCGYKKKGCPFPEKKARIQDAPIKSVLLRIQ